MKKLVLTMMIATGSLMYKAADAQVGVSVGFNIGPVSVQIHKPVYDDFYYLPDVEAYYSVPEHVYYYMDGDDWVSNPYLPGAYHDYDWRTARRYEVRAQRPYMNHSTYRSRFGGYGAGRMDWNRGRGNGGYAYNGPQRMEQRGGYNGGYPHSPYDSNNGRGRGGNYGQPGGYPSRGNWDNNVNRGGYGQPNNDNRGQGGYNRPDNDNRGQGGYNRPDNENRGQGGFGRPNNDNRDQGGYNGGQRGNDDNRGQGRPSNGGQWQNGNGGGQGGNYGQPSNQQNRGNGNQGGNQRYTNNQNEGRQRIPGRMMF